MLKIGLTGGIGSGKTTVCRIFELLNVPIFYADFVAKQIMYTELNLKRDIQEEFGEQSYSSEGLLNNKYLAHIVFNDKEKLEKLNAIVHPAMFRAFIEWSLQQSFPYVIKEAAILFESKAYKMCDCSVLVKAPLDLKIHRVMQRDKMSAEQILLRINQQLSDEQKQHMADFILINDEKKILIPQIIRLHRHFLKLSKQSVHDS